MSIVLTKPCSDPDTAHLQVYPDEAPEYGLSLVQAEYSADHRAFVAAMSAAIVRLKNHLLLTGIRDKAELLESFERICTERRSVEIERRNPQCARFGTPVPDSSAGILALASYTVDYVSRHDGDTDGGRHSFVFNRARMHLDNLNGPVVFRLGDIAVPLSRIRELRDDLLAVIHPCFRDVQTILPHAFDLLLTAAQAEPGQYHQVKPLLSQAYFLMMHANPWQRGSPSILESWICALNLARTGRGLGRKICEPFWEAILWNENDSWQKFDLFRCYEQE